MRPGEARQLRQVARQRHPGQLPQLGRHEGARPAEHALGHPQDQGPHAAGSRSWGRVGGGQWSQRHRAQSGPQARLGGRGRPVLRRPEGRVGLGKPERGGQQVPQL